MKDLARSYFEHPRYARAGLSGAAILLAGGLAVGCANAQRWTNDLLNSDAGFAAVSILRGDIDCNFSVLPDAHQASVGCRWGQTIVSESDSRADKNENDAHSVVNGFRHAPVYGTSNSDNGHITAFSLTVFMR